MLHWLLSSKYCLGHSPTLRAIFRLTQVQAKSLQANTTACTRTPSIQTLSAAPQTTSHSTWWAYTGSLQDHGCSRWDDVMLIGGMNNKKNLQSRISLPFLWSHRNAPKFPKFSCIKGNCHADLCLTCYGRPYTGSYLKSSPSGSSLTEHSMFPSYLSHQWRWIDGWSLAMSTPDPSFPTRVSTSNTTARVLPSPPVMQASHIQQD